MGASSKEQATDFEEQRTEINSLLEIAPEVLAQIHGGDDGSPCDGGGCCKWEPIFE